MRIIGIDPGIATIGFGVVSYHNNRCILEKCGVITTPAHTSLSSRLSRIYSDLTELLHMFMPDAVSIEELFFTKYYAHDYCPALGQFTVQENRDNRIELGNYPIVNVYANMDIKHTRFFVMMSHVNAGKGKRNYFFTPHYPLNENIIRFGVSWNFFN